MVTDFFNLFKSFFYELENFMTDGYAQEAKIN